MTKKELAAEWISADRLKPWDKNPRQNQPVRKVADSIKKFGWGSVLLARKDGTLVAGHTRLLAHKTLVAESRSGTSDWHPEAAHAAKHNVVPVRFGEWSERDAELLALADNKLNELADWDSSLGDLLGSFSLSEVDFAGFDFNELAQLTGHEETRKSADGSTAGPGPSLTYKIIVTCADEDSQADLLERLESEGIECQPLIS